MKRPDIDAIKARESAATKGPWTSFVVEDGAMLDQAQRGQVAFGSCPDGSPDLADASFCAHARQDIPDLIAYIEHLEARLEAKAQTCKPLLQVAQPDPDVCACVVPKGYFEETECRTCVKKKPEFWGRKTLESQTMEEANG